MLSKVMTHVGRSFSAEPLAPNELELAKESVGLFILIIDFTTRITRIG